MVRVGREDEGGIVDAIVLLGREDEVDVAILAPAKVALNGRHVLNQEFVGLLYYDVVQLAGVLGE